MAGDEGGAPTVLSVGGEADFFFFFSCTVAFAPPDFGLWMRFCKENPPQTNKQTLDESSSRAKRVVLCVRFSALAGSPLESWPQRIVILFECVLLTSK